MNIFRSTGGSGLMFSRSKSKTTKKTLKPARVDGAIDTRYQDNKKYLTASQTICD